jgi:signal transduction histidine kinase
MRVTFILLRSIGYTVTLLGLTRTQPALPWWQWVISFAVALWCVWDQWKKATDTHQVMRKGVWLEWLLVTLWAVLVREPFVLFLYLSPLARSCMHLLWFDSLSVLLSSIFASTAMCVWLHTPLWFRYSEVGTYIAVGLYTFVIGELNSERDKLRRELTISAFRRAERMKDEERLRIASELHDVMGQYWTAVVRALDVAMLMEGNERLQFIEKARRAALDGLQEMRSAVHRWNEGRQTAREWMAFMKSSVHRLADTTGIRIHLNISEPQWELFGQQQQRVAEVICRTVIESMTNAVRHGQATSMTIDIRPVNNEEVRVSIRDDGSGIKVISTQGESEGIGLKTMRELAGSIGGTLHLHSKRGFGVTVLLIIPYPTLNKTAEPLPSIVASEGM